MNVVPQDIFEKYKGIEDIDDPERARTAAVTFSKLHRISHQVTLADDPLSGRCFLWSVPGKGGEFNGILEVVGALDAHVSYALYKSHWVFNSKQALIECRAELIRSMMVIKNVDISRAEGLMMRDDGRGRPVWTGELLTIELLRVLGVLLGKEKQLAASKVTPRQREAEPMLASDLTEEHRK